MKTFNFILSKKHLAVHIIMLVFLSTAKSQEVTIGSLLSMNYTLLWNSNINGSLDNEATMSSNFSGGFNYGIDAHLSLNKYFDMSLGLIRANQNQSHTLNYNIAPELYSSELNTRLDYLDIPLLIRYKANWFYLEAGPQVGFLLNAEEKFYGDAYRDVTSSFNPVNLMFDFGTGFSYKIHGRFSMTGGIRMGMGLSDITQKYSNASGIPYDAATITKMAHTSVEDYYWVDILLGQTNGAFTYESYSYKKTHRYYVGLMLSLRYNLFANKTK